MLYAKYVDYLNPSMSINDLASFVVGEVNIIRIEKSLSSTVIKGFTQHQQYGLLDLEFTANKATVYTQRFKLKLQELSKI